MYKYMSKNTVKLVGTWWVTRFLQRYF